MVQTNATLTAINSAGARDRHGDVADEGALKWSGTRRGYLTRRTRSVSVGDARADGGQRRERVKVDVLVLRGRLPISVEPGDQSAGDTIVVVDHRSGEDVEKRFRVVGVDMRAVGSAVDSATLELADERAV